MSTHSNNGENGGDGGGGGKGGAMGVKGDSDAIGGTATSHTPRVSVLTTTLAPPFGIGNWKEDHAPPVQHHV